jgi:hypothetical protein
MITRRFIETKGVRLLVVRLRQAPFARCGGGAG